MLTRKEKNLIISLLEAQKGSIIFLRGFGKITLEEKQKKDFYNKLINKIKNYYKKLEINNKK